MCPPTHPSSLCTATPPTTSSGSPGHTTGRGTICLQTVRGVPCHEVAPSKRSFQSLFSLISAHEVPTMIVIVQRSASLAHCTCGCDVSLLTAPRSHSFGGLHPASMLLMYPVVHRDKPSEESRFQENMESAQQAICTPRSNLQSQNDLQRVVLFRQASIEDLDISEVTKEPG